MLHDFTDPHHVTAGYVGKPGRRTFFIQAEDEHVRMSFLCEKAQVKSLSEAMARLLGRVGDHPATDWDRQAMELREPITITWRVGEISLGVDPETLLFAIELGEYVPEDEDREPEEIRIRLLPDQARRLCAHAFEKITEGRPACQFCDQPLTEGVAHVCPAMN